MESLFLFLLFLPVVFSFRKKRVQKERAGSVLRQAKIYALVITIVWSIVLLYGFFALIPSIEKMYRVYRVFSYPSSILTAYASVFIGATILGLIVSSLYVWFSKSIEEEFKKRVASYKNGEMIDTKHLVQGKLKRIMIGMTIVPAIIVAVFYLFPLSILLIMVKALYRVGPM